MTPRATSFGRARFVVTCKRNDASRQRRKLTKREEVREVERERVERRAKEALEAKNRPPAPYAAATSEREATERVDEAFGKLTEASEVLRERKERARGSEEWDANVGYRAHRDVMEALREFETARIRCVETRLERGLCLFTEVKGDGDWKTLDAFNWRYGAALEGENAKCLEYMLPAVCKANAPRAVAEICAVALDGGKTGPIELSQNVIKQAVKKLEDADEFDLLSDEEAAVLHALREA
jgi:hypothetical protein